MRLTQGTRVTVKGVSAYFQLIDRGSLLLCFEDGSLGWYSAHEVKMEADPRENIIREFIEYAAENKVAPTELVNEALKAVG